MKLSKKNRLIYSLIYGLYLALIAVLFDFSDLLYFQTNSLFVSLVIGVLAALVQYSNLLILFKVSGNTNKWKIALTVIVTNWILFLILAFFILNFSFSFLFALFSGLLVAAIVPAIILFLFLFFDEVRMDLNAPIKSLQTDAAAPSEQQKSFFLLEQQKGRKAIEIPTGNILCFEANDNYVTIYYLNDQGILQKQMERLSMRKAEELIAQTDLLFKRVHKSYLVNTKHIQTISGKAQAYKIILHHLDFQIPVSRNIAISELEG